MMTVAKTVERNFLFLRAGHRFFWLPQRLGSPLVGSCCILFLIILVTGLIWWYPKKWNAATRNKSLAVKWKANWKRLNIDLHNVLGFYAFLVAMILTFTGITFTFSWLNNGYHKVLTGKAYKEEEKRPASDASLPSATGIHSWAADTLWQKYATFIKSGSNTVNIFFPEDSVDTWLITIIPIQGRVADRPEYFHDRNSLKLVKKSEDYESLPAAEKIVQDDVRYTRCHHLGTAFQDNGLTGFTGMRKSAGYRLYYLVQQEIWEKKTYYAIGHSGRMKRQSKTNPFFV